MVLESSASPTSTSPESTLPVRSGARAAATRSAARACASMTGAALISAASARLIAIATALIDPLTYAPTRRSASRREGECDRQAHQHPYRSAMRAARTKQRLQDVHPSGRLEAGMRAL